MSNGENLTVFNKMENKLLNSKEMDKSKYTMSSRSLENSTLKDEEEEIEENFNKNEKINYRERQLSILLDAFLTSYSKKSYNDLIKDIEEKEDLLYQNSTMSFRIKIIKIKGLMKLLKEEYNYYLQLKKKTFHDLDRFIYKIKNEFNIISTLLIKNDSYENEIITQIYCKFLYLLSKISLKREDYLKAVGYISLGVNMIKIYVIKKKVASDIKTYEIYCKLLLELINILIGDNNYEQGLLYIRLLFKIIESSLKFIYSNNQENKDKIPIKIIKKFISYGAIAYIYTGCCLEKLDNNIQAFEAYKQAKYFFKKSSKLGISFQNLNSITINNSCSFLAEDVLEKMKIKFEKDKIEKLNRQKKLEMLKKKEEYELLQNEKLMKLKYIANGIIGDPFKFGKLEDKLNQKLFPSSIVNSLERIDDDLMSLVLTYYNKNKKKNISSYNDKMSSQTKNIMSRYEIYNILMSKDFRDFIMKTKKLQFYNPKAGSESISIIQRHLNNKIKIESDSKKRNSQKKMSLKLLSSNLESPRKNHKMNTIENLGTTTTSPNSQREEEKIIEKILSKTDKKIKMRNNNLKYLLSQNTALTERESKKKKYFLIYLNTTKSMKNIRNKHKFKKNFNELEFDFERKNLDKNLMTKNYLRKYSYYNKLSSKELKMQKLILYFKHNNTLYNKKGTVEEKDGIIGKDDIAKISLIINEKAKVKPVIDENIKQLNLIKDSFSSIEKKMSVKMKSAMSKVISKYIYERKKNHLTKTNIVNSDEMNEKKLLQLNYSIKNINKKIMNIKFLGDKYK